MGFTDLKPYKKRLEDIWSNSSLSDSIRVGVGKVDGEDIVIACMDFEFIGGSGQQCNGREICPRRRLLY